MRNEEDKLCPHKLSFMIHTLSFNSIEETLLHIFYIFSCVLEQEKELFSHC